MEALKRKFDSLGFDLVPLDQLNYVTAGSDDGIILPPTECPGDVCNEGCANGCKSCKPGCNAGGK